MWITIVLVLTILLIACIGCLYILYARLRKSQKADCIKQIFLMSMNHEIRVPLEAIAGLADMILSLIHI